jgi:hypothetical protein
VRDDWEETVTPIRRYALFIAPVIRIGCVMMRNLSVRKPEQDGRRRAAGS